MKYILKLFILINILYILQVIQSQKTTRDIKNKICNVYKKESGNEDNIYTKSQIHTNSEIKDAKQFIQDKVKDKKYLKDFIDKKIEAGELITNLINDIMPYLVFFVISLLVAIVYQCCFFADLCCPKIICCKKKSEYSKFELIWPLVGLLAFGIWVFIAAGFGIHKGITFTDGYYLLKCQTIAFLDDFNVEKKEQSWVGLEQLTVKLNDIDSKFVQQVQVAFGTNGKSWIENDYAAQLNQSRQLWEKDRNQYTYATFPNVNLVQENVQPPATSQFFNNVWGDLSRIGTHTYVYNTIIIGLESLKNAMTSTQNVAFGAAIKDGKKEITNIQEKIFEGAEQILNDTKDIDDTYLPMAEQITTAYFSVSLVCSFLGVLGAVIVVLLKMVKFRFLMHLAWCLFSLWMVLGFLLSSVLYGVSIVGFQGCDVVSDVLTDYNELKNLNIFGADVLEKIKTCKIQYGGDGKLLKEFGLETELTRMKDLNKEMNDVLNKNAEQTGNLELITLTINKGKDNLNSLKSNGSYKNLLEQQQYEYNLIADPFGCAAELKFRNGDLCAVETPIDQVLGNPAANTCGYIHTYNNNPAPANFAGCLNDNNKKNVFSWILLKNRIVDSKLADLTIFGDLNTSYQNNIVGWIQGVQNFSDDVDSLLTDISDIIENKTQCTFIGENMDKLHEALCVDLIPDIYWLSINLIISSFGMLFGSYFFFCAGFRYANLKTNNVDVKYKNENNNNKDIENNQEVEKNKEIENNQEVEKNYKVTAQPQN